LSKQKTIRITGLTKSLQISKRLLVALVCTALCISTWVALVGESSVSRAFANGSTTITLSPTPATITGCETVAIQIMVNDVVDLYGVDVRLSFNPAVLEVVDDLPDSGINIQPEETFLTNLWVVRNEVNNGTGTIWYAATQLYPSTPKSGSGALATIHLKAKTMGTSAMSFTYTKLAEINGVVIPATPTNGSVQTSGAFTPSLSITKLNSSDVRLSWSSVSGVSGYHLFRATTPTSPYFTPSDPAYQVTTNLFYDDLGVLGDVNLQHYYTLKAACANGFKSNSSNRVGEYDYALRSATASNYNDIAMVLDMPTITYASSLATYIGSSAKFISQFKPGTQSWQTYVVPNSSTDFSLTTGQFVFVITDNTAPASVAMVGGVPISGSISFSLVSGSPPKYNYLSLPLDQGNLTKASEVVSDIGAGVLYLMRYRIETQSYQAYQPGNPSTDFNLVIGEPFALVLTTGAPSQWP